MPVAEHPGPGLGESLMLTLPLNETTLGPAFREKIIELRTVMKPTSSK